MGVEFGWPGTLIFASASQPHLWLAAEAARSAQQKFCDDGWFPPKALSGWVSTFHPLSRVRIFRGTSVQEMGATARTNTTAHDLDLVDFIGVDGRKVEVAVGVVHRLLRDPVWSRQGPFIFSLSFSLFGTATTTAAHRKGRD